MVPWSSSPSAQHASISPESAGQQRPLARLAATHFGLEAHADGPLFQQQTNEFSVFFFALKDGDKGRRQVGDVLAVVLLLHRSGSRALRYMLDASYHQPFYYTKDIAVLAPCHCSFRKTGKTLGVSKHRLAGESQPFLVCDAGKLAKQLNHITGFLACL